MDWPTLIDYFFKIIVLTGGGYLIFFMKNTYEREIAVYKAQIDFLNVTQVEKFVDRINKLRELYEGFLKERDSELNKLKKEMEELQNKHLSKIEIIKSQKELVDKLKTKLLQYDSESWIEFLNVSKQIIAKDYNDIIVDRGSDSIMWTIKFKDDKSIRKYEFPIKIKKGDKE